MSHAVKRIHTPGQLTQPLVCPPITIFGYEQAIQQTIQAAWHVAADSRSKRQLAPSSSSKSLAPPARELRKITGDMRAVFDGEKAANHIINTEPHAMTGSAEVTTLELIPGKHPQPVFTLHIPTSSRLARMDNSGVLRALARASNGTNGEIELAVSELLSTSRSLDEYDE